MAEFFSAYVQPRRDVKPLLARAALVLAAALVCRYLLRMVPTPYAFVLVVAGGILWAISMAAAALRPNRVILSFAIFGAMLVGTGGLAYVFGGDCWCIDGRDPVVRFLRTVTGESRASGSIVCL